MHFRHDENVVTSNIQCLPAYEKSMFVHYRYFLLPREAIRCREASRQLYHLAHRFTKSNIVDYIDILLLGEWEEFTSVLPSTPPEPQVEEYIVVDDHGHPIRGKYFIRRRDLLELPPSVEEIEDDVVTTTNSLGQQLARLTLQ